ncbi:MAG: hypothetical protein ACYTF9_10410 [Planctomycetota bacterium]|jgi:hypothetical protein
MSARQASTNAWFGAPAVIIYPSIDGGKARIERVDSRRPSAQPMT